jgi:hypothetical protein
LLISKPDRIVMRHTVMKGLNNRRRGF